MNNDSTHEGRGSPPLKQQALRGVFWSFTERFGVLGGQFLVSIILARLLSPTEFGLVGMITIFTLLAQVVVESGFGQALIQKRNCSHADESTAFWFNLLAGCLMTLALFLSAPLIATFYEQPQLLTITRVVSFNLLTNSFGVVQNALLQKELSFRKRSIASITGITLSGTAGIAMAFMGFGVWALVVQIMANNLTRTAMLWIVHPWRPLFKFSATSFESLFRFGSNMLLAGLTNTIFNNVYLLIIGKIYSAEALGYYQRAQEFIVASAHSVSQVVAQINFPVMSKLQNEPDRMRYAFRDILQTTLYIVTPLMIGLATTAPSIIYLLLGEKWMPCVPFLQLLCIIGGLFPAHLLNLNIVTALGRSDLFFRMEILRKAFVAIFIALTYRHGVIALLQGQVASNVLALLINCHLTHKLLKYGLVKQARDNLKMIASGTIMGFCVWGIGEIWTASNTLQLLLAQIPMGATIYLLSSIILKDRVFLSGYLAISTWIKGGARQNDG